MQLFKMFDRKKAENFIRRLRWKAFHYCKNSPQPVNEPVSGSFGFKATATPPQNDHLNAFENDLYDLIQQVKFTHVQNTFQENLKKDIQNIKSSPKKLVFADKSTNLYELSRGHYDKLLHDNFTQAHKKAGPQAKRNIDKESKKFAKSLDLNEKMECYSDQNVFITLKDHKDNLE